MATLLLINISLLNTMSGIVSGEARRLMMRGDALYNELKNEFYEKVFKMSYS
jgi:hypothetical protein